MKRMRFDQAKNWVTENKKVVIGVSIAVVVVVIGGSFLIAQQIDNTIERTDPTGSGASSKPEVTFEPSPLTGVSVSPQLASRPITAIMVENSPEARPQSGLVDAGVVYEAIAEGGITRFVTFFQEAQPEVVGPVRSLRPYYIDWVRQFDAAVAHVGGSTQALRQVKAFGVKDLDEFANAGAYWRDSARYAPHNAYTSTENLDKLIKQKGFTDSDIKPIERKPDQPKEVPDVTRMTVNISSCLYSPGFE